MSRGGEKSKSNKKNQLSRNKIPNSSLIKSATIKPLKVIKNNASIPRKKHTKRNILIVLLIIFLPPLFIIVTRVNTLDSYKKNHDTFNPNFSLFIKRQIKISDERSSKIDTILGDSYDTTKSKAPTSSEVNIDYSHRNFSTNYNFSVTTGVSFDSSQQKELDQNLLIDLTIAKDGLFDEVAFSKIIQTYSDNLNPNELVTNIKTVCTNFKKNGKASFSLNKGNIRVSVSYVSEIDNNLCMTVIIIEDKKDPIEILEND
ncbi:hypothetical protein [Clostridium akagii]|uniref:hypothetical protein n=1 Tax=Clostridium akagii TaxID=91623 RepID=UPI00047A77DD|nr:hypothetical protein [Clostridium akagii]